MVASFSIIADLAKNVGGSRIALTTLVGPNGDAHVYEPQPADAAAMAAADVVLVNGLDFEGFLERLVEASGTHAAVVELTRGVAAIPWARDRAGEAAEDDATATPERSTPMPSNPSPMPRSMSSNIADAFCTADPDGCREYRDNAAAYTAILSALDAEVRQAVATIPAEKRVIITSHDAFGYFAHEYGITFLAPQGVSTDAEASAADVAGLIRQVRQDQAAAVFVENITNPPPDRPDRGRDRADCRRGSLLGRAVGRRRAGRDLCRR